MRLSSVFALAVIVASASSVSAIDDSTDHCPIFCKIGDDAHCKHGTEVRLCMLGESESCFCVRSILTTSY
ncbi:hypothetical protein CY34DRAFT_810820 [Suillus luteus UH-Slu-Lm8-n1]|uniref:Extracellular membrane protein CFEM domain-containing protein n=1 Tax=Suillus luteus UH-Slu-Lm8-n1 TaxID=930992 RepID=A0A0C9ZHX7_9AGAM|nr:hypothetical protein CY34DRAFT_810820 [Suillus luteus UH-Slu-Lm8-n1]